MIKFPEGEALFDFVDTNIVQFMLETVYIGDRKDQAMAERSFKVTVVLKNTIFPWLGLTMFIASLGVGGNKIIGDRVPAHYPCQDLGKVDKLVDNLTKNTKKLQEALKIIIVKQENGHK